MTRLKRCCPGCAVSDGYVWWLGLKNRRHSSPRKKTVSSNFSIVFKQTRIKAVFAYARCNTRTFGNRPSDRLNNDRGGSPMSPAERWGPRGQTIRSHHTFVRAITVVHLQYAAALVFAVWSRTVFSVFFRTTVAFVQIDSYLDGDPELYYRFGFGNSDQSTYSGFRCRIVRRLFITNTIVFRIDHSAPFKYLLILSAR